MYMICLQLYIDNLVTCTTTYVYIVLVCHFNKSMCYNTCIVCIYATNRCMKIILICVMQ